MKHDVTFCLSPFLKELDGKIFKIESKLDAWPPSIMEVSLETMKAVRVNLFL